MKPALRLTLDGLVRALRGRLHTLAENVEAGYRSGTRPRAVSEAGTMRRGRVAEGSGGRKGHRDGRGGR